MKRKSILLVFFLFAGLLSGEVNNLIFQLETVVLENVTIDFGLLRLSSTFGCAVYDANQDGWPDLLISNHGKPPVIFVNVQGRSFREARELLSLQGADRHSPAMADFDNDGDQDLYFLKGAHSGTGEGPKEFYLNPGHGQPFVYKDIPVLADPKGRGRTSVWFDYDNDGYLDLYNAYNKREDAPNRLFHNNGGTGSFTDVTTGSNLGIHINSIGGSIAADFDSDGDMDLFVTNTDARPYLYMNLGNGVFQDETLARGIGNIPRTWAAGVADFNDDGKPDLYISRGVDGDSADGVLNDAHRLNFMEKVAPPGDMIDEITFNVIPDATLAFEFPIRDINANFVFIGAEGKNPSSLVFNAGHGGISADGRPNQWMPDGSRRGIYIWKETGTTLWHVATAAGSQSLQDGGVVATEGKISNVTMIQMEPSNIPQYPNVFFKNTGGGHFVDVTKTTRTGDPSNSRSPLWVDLDNDTDLDLFVVNAGFNGPGKQSHVCYINNGGGVFESYPLAMGPIEQFGRGDGGVVADFNRDGRQDLFIVNGSGLLPESKGPYQLYLNRTDNRNRWIKFRLIGGGKDYTNRDAIGAKVRVVPTGTNHTYWRYITGGSGSNSLSGRVLHFGLGEFSEIDATVFWPRSKTFPNGHQQNYHYVLSQLNQSFNLYER